MSRVHRLLAIAFVGGVTACRADGPAAPLPLAPRAQATSPGMIAGRVTTADSRAPLFGANAQLISLDGRVVESVGSDSLGSYAFKPVAAGAYRVRVRAIGYRPSISAPLLLDAASAELPDVSLHKDDIRLTCNLVFVGVQGGASTKRAGVKAPASRVPVGPASRDP